MKNTNQHTKLSRFLSLVLRHKPQTINLNLDSNGWADVKDLLAKMNQTGRRINLETLKIIVETNNKQRFAFNEHGDKIRANQGHSIEIELDYEATIPPEILYHGTASKYTNSIFKSGIEKRQRHHVHLSSNIDTALNVGQRHGFPVILEVLAKEMQENGHEFFVSKNEVWLTDHVPVKYLRKMENH